MQWLYFYNFNYMAIVNHIASISSMKLFCLSLALCHGVFDFYESDDLNITRELFNISYQFTIIIFITLISLFPPIWLCVFLWLTMYHFGEDYRYIVNTDNISARLLGCVVMGCTLFYTDSIQEWNQLIDIVCNGEYTGARLANIKHYIKWMLMVCYINGLWIILWYGNMRIIFTALLVIGLGYIIKVPSQLIMCHLMLLHVPLASWRIYNKNGIKPIIYWLVVSCIVYIIICIISCFIMSIKGITKNTKEEKGKANYMQEYGTENNIELGVLYTNLVKIFISLTIPHMIITTVWQLMF